MSRETPQFKENQDGWSPYMTYFRLYSALDRTLVSKVWAQVLPVFLLIIFNYIFCFFIIFIKILILCLTFICLMFVSHWRVTPMNASVVSSLFPTSSPTLSTMPHMQKAFNTSLLNELMSYSIVLVLYFIIHNGDITHFQELRPCICGRQQIYFIIHTKKIIDDGDCNMYLIIIRTFY